MVDSFEAHVYEANFSPNGEQVVTASADNTARIFSAKGECLRSLAKLLHI